MIDLHLHLDGSLPQKAIKELMLLNFARLDDETKRIINNSEELKAKLQVPVSCESLKDYLTCFDLPLRLLQTETSMKVAVKALLEELRTQGMRYVEIRFAPQFHSNDYYGVRKLEHETAIVKAAIDASNEVEGINCNFILCMMRGSLDMHNMRTLQIAECYKNRGVVAVDLAGDEAAYPTSMYKELFKKAKDMGLDYTIHAGEAGGFLEKVKSVEDAINFGAKRIGHGIALRFDSNLRDLCKKRGIGIECCPTSNLQTKAIENVDFHPIYSFISEGLKVSVNTDNTTVSDTSINNEFERLNVDGETKKILIKNAIDMAFLSDEEKKTIFPEWVK